MPADIFQRPLLLCGFDRPAWWNVLTGPNRLLVHTLSAAVAIRALGLGSLEGNER